MDETVRSNWQGWKAGLDENDAIQTQFKNYITSIYRYIISLKYVERCVNMQENWKIKSICYVIFAVSMYSNLLVMDVFDTWVFISVESSEI